MSIVRPLTGVLMLLALAAPARAGSMRDCTAQGGTYFEDGRSELGRDDARKSCLRQGGHFRADGSCEIRRDPVQTCKEMGGDGMAEGHCWRFVRPGDRRR
jgi:hypothetical protein